jgi:RNA polymerase sigma-70 factor (ECF subfamily)
VRIAPHDQDDPHRSFLPHDGARHEVRVNLPLDDHAVVTRIVHGDGDALAALMRRHRPTVVRHLRRYPFAPDARDSIAGDVMTDMVRKLATFNGETNFTTWLYRVTANTALHHMRALRPV